MSLQKIHQVTERRKGQRNHKTENNQSNGNIKSILTMITLNANVNELNMPNQRHRMAEWVKKGFK